MAVDATQRDDLRRVYLAIYDNFAIHHSELARSLKGINSRYARELCATLQQGDLVVITESDEGDCWQTLPTYDTMTREEAEAKFDEWAGEPPSPVNATHTGSSPRSSLKSSEAGAHPCRCGCGEVITTRSVYRPGHDARHAGAVGRQVAREVMETGGGAADLETDADRFAVLPSDALKAKALRIANKELGTLMRQGKNRTLTRNTKPRYIEGIIKVGKTEYPGRKWPTANGKDEQFEYLGTKGWVAASKTAAKTFQEA